MDRDHRRTAVAIDELWRRPLTRRRALQGAAAVGLSSAALGQFVVREAVAADAKTLVVASGADAVTLDPQVSFDGQSPLLWRAVYENLVKYDGDTLDIVPNLAESYEVSEDGLTYTFTIRPGITFTDGAPLDAAAVKLSIEAGISRGLGDDVFSFKGELNVLGAGAPKDCPHPRSSVASNDTSPAASTKPSEQTS